MPSAANEFPYLANLLDSYFHQDAYAFGDSDEDIIDAFVKSSWPYQRLGVRADIGRVLHEYGDKLADVIRDSFAPAVIIGSTNDEVRAWLTKVDRLLS